MIKRLFGAALVLLVSGLLFVAPFQKAPSIYLESKFHPLSYAVSLKNIGESMFLGANGYAHEFESLGMGILAYAIFLPAFVLLLAGLLLRSGKITSRVLLLVVSLLMGIGTLYLLLLILSPFAVMFIPFVEGEYQPSPNSVAFLILAWMIGWTLYGLVSACPSLEQINRALQKWRKLVGAFARIGLVLSIASLLTQMLSWFSSAETGMQYINILAAPLVVIANAVMFFLMDVLGMSRTITIWHMILVMSFLVPLHVSLAIPVLAFKKTTVEFSNKWLWVAGALLLSLGSLYTAGVVSFMLSTIYMVVMGSREIPILVQNIDFAFGLFVLIWGQLSALSILLMTLRGQRNDAKPFTLQETGEQNPQSLHSGAGHA
jgi:hypothetical protein